MNSNSRRKMPTHECEICDELSDQPVRVRPARMIQLLRKCYGCGATNWEQMKLCNDCYIKIDDYTSLWCPSCEHLVDNAPAWT